MGCSYQNHSLLPQLWASWTPIVVRHRRMQNNIDGSVQDCSNSIANALKLLQSYTKPSMKLIIGKQTQGDSVFICGNKCKTNSKFADSVLRYSYFSCKSNPVSLSHRPDVIMSLDLVCEGPYRAYSSTTWKNNILIQDHAQSSTNLYVRNIILLSYYWTMYRHRISWSLWHNAWSVHVLSYKTCLDTKPVLYQDRLCI